MGLERESMTRLRDRLVAQEISAEALMRDTLAAMERGASYNAFARTVSPVALIEQAQAVDAARAAGAPLGPLAGLPVALKDNICQRGEATTAASKILEGFVSPYDATVVARLREAGALLVGATNMDEFAMGSSNETSAYGPVHNPADPDTVPGGSSGGSAAAVASFQCVAALGSDTGGSIRQPASHCGIVGLKPTYGRVSRFGLIAFASSLDQIGPMTRTVEDAALLLETIAGHDPHDMTSAFQPVEPWSAAVERGVKGKKLGIPREYFVEDAAGDAALDPEVRAHTMAAIERLEREGAELVELSLPHTEYAVATYYLLATAEASSNLARFDGVRYGHRAAHPADLTDMYERTRAEGFGPEVKRRIMLGTFVLSAGFYDAYYTQAQKARTLIRQDFERAFRHVDAIVTPTAPTPAFGFGAKTANPLQMYLEDIYTIPCNLAGLPGISVPSGRTSAGLPVGLQVLGRPFDEATVLRVGRAAIQHDGQGEGGAA